MAANVEGFAPAGNFCSTARLGRNFLLHGQNTTAWSELQLLITSIPSPGWRKAHVVCREIVPVLS
jgi:hypothetical protein